MPFMKPLRAIASRLTFDRAIRLCWLLLAFYLIQVIQGFPERLGGAIPASVEVQLSGPHRLYDAPGKPVQIQIER